MAQAVYGSMYYILSSTRHDWPYGLSPGGLPNGEEYMGHTFWDQDIWMYPPLVLLHPDLARSSMRYRKNRLPAARRIAKEYGYKGKKAAYHVKVLTIHRIIILTQYVPDQWVSLINITNVFSTITTTVFIYMELMLSRREDRTIGNGFRENAWIWRHLIISSKFLLRDSCRGCSKAVSKFFSHTLFENEKKWSPFFWQPHIARIITIYLTNR